MIRLERINPVTYIKDKKDFQKMNAEDAVKNLIKNLRARINEIDSKTQITEGTDLIDDAFFAKGVAFKIARDAENNAEHLLEVSVLHPQKQIELTRPLVYGNKYIVSDYLNNDKNADTVLQQIREMCAELRAE